MAGLLYLKVPTFRGELAEVEGPSIIRWLKVNSKSTSTIVFDVRGNGGGSDLFWMKYLVGPLISSTMTHETTVLYRGGALSQPFLRAKHTGLQPAIGFPLFTSLSHESDRVEPTGDNIPHGPVVVLMDHGCFSATEGFVAFCRATGFATTVGTNSGGDGVGFDPILVELAATHLVLSIPICGGLNPDGKLNYEEGTRPDIVLDPGEDALEYVKAHGEPSFVPSTKEDAWRPTTL